MRKAGRPTATAKAAVKAAASGAGPGPPGAHGHEGELAQAHLPGPAGEHHQRQRHDGVEGDDTAEVRLPGGGDERVDHHERQPDHDEHPAGDADGRDGQQLPRDRPLFLAGLPGAGHLVTAPERLALLDEEPDGDDQEQPQVDQRLVLVERELHRLRDDGDADGGEHRGRQVPHAADDGGGQRREQDAGGEPRGRPRLGEDAGQGHAGPAQQPGQRPDQRRQAADADAEQGGPLGVLGHGPHRHAGAGEAEEGRQRQQEEHRHLDGEDVGEPEGNAVAADAEVESGERQLVMERSGAQRLGERERLRPGEEREPAHEVGRRLRQEPGHHDRHHGQHQSRRPEEAPDQRQVEGHADQRREAEPQQEGHDEGHPGVLHEVEREDGAGRADGRLGEVDDPQRPVDEDDPGGGEGVDETEDEAPEEDGGRRPPAGAARPRQDDLGEEGDDHDRQRPAEHRSTSPAHFAAPGCAGGTGSGDGCSCPSESVTSVVPWAVVVWICSLMIRPPSWGATM
jgi:hypothetical protein